MVVKLWDVEDLFLRLEYLRSENYSDEDIGKLVFIITGEIPYKKMVSYFILNNAKLDILKDVEGVFQYHFRMAFDKLCNLHHTLNTIKDFVVNSSIYNKDKNINKNIESYLYNEELNQNIFFYNNIKQLKEGGLSHLLENRDFKFEEALRGLFTSPRFSKAEKTLFLLEEEKKLIGRTIENYVVSLAKEERYEDIGSAFLSGARAFHNNPERKKSICVKAYKRFAENHLIQTKLNEKLKNKT